MQYSRRYKGYSRYHNFQLSLNDYYFVCQSLLNLCFRWLDICGKNRVFERRGLGSGRGGNEASNAAMRRINVGSEYF
jgi:hypothetical protein